MAVNDEDIARGETVQTARERGGRPLVERPDAMDHAAATRPADRLSRLDPAVVGRRLGRVHAEQQEPFRMIPDVPARGGDVAHEDRLLHDEVVGGEDRDHGARRPGSDPVRGQQHPRRGAPVAGLGEHRDLGVPGELARHVVGVARLGHRDGPRGWDQPRHPVQGVAQQRLRVACAPGEDDRPEIASRIEHGFDLPRDGRDRAAAFAPDCSLLYPGSSTKSNDATSTR